MANLNDVDWSQLPSPEDDGGAAHLEGLTLPSAPLPATDGSTVDLTHLPGCVVLYIYPMTGRPDVPLPDGWDGIPGARGCTPQSCAFRDHFAELKSLGVDHLFGLSTQTTEYQAEAAERMHLPFPLLSDARLSLAEADPYRGGHDPAQAHGSDPARGPDREMFLPGLPTRPKRRRCDRLAQDVRRTEACAV